MFVFMYVQFYVQVYSSASEFLWRGEPEESVKTRGQDSFCVLSSISLEFELWALPTLMAMQKPLKEGKTAQGNDNEKEDMRSLTSSSAITVVGRNWGVRLSYHWLDPANSFLAEFRTNRYLLPKYAITCQRALLAS